MDAQRASTRASRALWLNAGLAGFLAMVLPACSDSKSPTSPSNGPTVTAVSPNSGTTFGGTIITITGTKFEAGATVTIGGAPATEVTVQSPTSLTARTAQHAAGQVDVAVAVGGVTGTLRNGFTYTAQGAVTNTPPTIASFKALGTRSDEPQNFADVGETINVTAYVADEETPIDQLTYAWSAPAGTFSGSGPAVQWTAPGGDPKDYTLTLTITENYQTADANGLPVTKQNTTTGTVTVSVHDSVREIGDLAYTFLVDFSEQKLSPEQVVRNFYDGCRGTDDELGDVQRNQQQKTITSYRVDPTRVNVDFNGACGDRARPGDACAQNNVDWRSTDKSTGKPEHAYGVDQMSAVYRNSRWYLCSSDFIGTTTSATHPFLGARVVPGTN